MEHDQRLVTIRAMQAFGGSFVKSLAATWLLADKSNSDKIEAAFSEYIEKYGPGRPQYQRMSEVEA